MRFHLAMLVSLLALAGCATKATDAVLGQAPSYLTDGPTYDVPNGAALQHLTDTRAGRQLRPAGPHERWRRALRQQLPARRLTSRPTPAQAACSASTPRRAASPAVSDVPLRHLHPLAGLAYVGQDRLLLADTRQLFLIDLPRALAAGSQGAARTLKIAGDLRGSYATFDGRDAWIGTWFC